MDNTKELKKMMGESQKNLKRLMIMNFLLIIFVVGLISLFFYTNSYKNQNAPNSNTQASSSNPNSVAQQQSGKTLANINQPLNRSELAVINNAPLSYYEIAGEKLLNNTLTNQVVLSNTTLQYNALIINGKPSVIYIGAITCPFCGENRWAMALALSRFGNFTALYKGYSSLDDGDTTTLYFGIDNYTTSADVSFNSSYISNKINFISAEYESPLTQGFQIQPQLFLQKSPNAIYTRALNFMFNINKFQGTPFTFWGTSLNQGADAVIFGNTTQSSPSILNAGWSHSQVIGLLKNFNSQFAWSEYAAADIYIAQVCPSIGNNSSVCRLPAIIKIEQAIGTL